MSTLKRGSIAVVGAAESDLGQVAPHTNPMDLIAQATLAALDDCGLKLQDIDGVFSAMSQARVAPMAVAETYSTPMRGQQYGSSSPAPRPKQPISIRRRGPTRSDQRPTCTAMNREKIEYSENRMPTSNGVPPKSIAYSDTSILLPL